MTFSAALGVSAFFLSLTAGAQVPARLSPDEVQFVDAVGRGNLAEIAMGTLAIQNGASRAVKDFGEVLVSDHEKLNLDLEQTIKVYGEVLPTRLDSEAHAHVEMLSAKKGPNFDDAFAKHIVKSHRKMLTLFKNAAESGGAEPLKQFALRNLLTLEKHLQIATGLGPVKTSSR